MFCYHGCPKDLTSEERADLILYDVLMRGDVNDVRHVVQHTKRDLNEVFTIVRDKQKHEHYNPMHLVCSCGTVAVLKFLIEVGCDVNRRTKRFNRTPVHTAVLKNNISCLQLLITARAKLDTHDIFGSTPCHYAAELGYHDILDVMIRIGTNVNSQDIAEKTPLMKAVRSNKTESTVRLIRANANLNITDKNNEIALHFAARNGNTELVDVLLSSGSLINVQNIWGRTPLIEAVYYNKKNVVEHLLAADCNISIRVLKAGETALHIAVRKKYVQVTRKLLEYILSSPVHTMYMLATYDLDVNKYTCWLDEESGNKVTLFYIAATRFCFQTCHVLASLGFVDYSCRPLFQASITNVNLSETDHKSLLSVLEMTNSVILLKQVCRNVIRCSIGYDISDRASTLPVPEQLKDYLLFKEEHKVFMSCKQS
uniref:SOCS box domain-containing protein n=1 Tax=Arion vulgaris TaxID=1028688 RepID=A0A0B7AMS2_9EUPU